MNMNRPKIRKFYFLSLLCLFPLYGIIVGVILSCYAIFKFKSLPLFLTILGMTIGGWFVFKLDSYYLQQDLKYGKDVGNLFALQAADDLDQIAQRCEKYKLKYGNYPDSLQQLKKEYPSLEIMDPLLGRNSAAYKSINFHYEKKGQGYLLFSSGIDGIPNTSDDIYPRKNLK